MSRLLMVLGAVTSAPILLVPAFLVAIAAGPVLATALLAVSCWLVRFVSLNAVRALAVAVGHVAARPSAGQPSDAAR